MIDCVLGESSSQLPRYSTSQLPSYQSSSTDSDTSSNGESHSRRRKNFEAFVMTGDRMINLAKTPGPPPSLLTVSLTQRGWGPALSPASSPVHQRNLVRKQQTM